MKTEAKEYVKTSLEEKTEISNYGFLVVNTYKTTASNPIFKNSNVFVVEFDEQHGTITKINSQEIAGSGNMEKMKNFANTQHGENEFTTHQIFWHADVFLEELKKYRGWNNSKLPLPHLKKGSATIQELKTFCKKANNINFEECKTANQRATPMAVKQ